MASTYSTDLKLELMVTGENAGTWGTKTNTNLNLLQQAIAGYQDISIAGGAQTTALTMDNAAISNARNAVIKLTGTITGNQIVTVPNGIEKTYIIENNTTGAFTVEFKTASGTGPTWSTTDKGIKILFADGTNIVDVNADLSASTFASISSGSISSGQIDILAQAELRLQDTAGGQYVGFKAPGTVSSSYTLTLPTATGTAGQTLVTNGSGVLSFAQAGRTGAVNWDTTKKTTGFTAVNGVGYFCDTSGGAFTATLPITPTAGDIVAFSDYTGTWGTNNLTVGRNGSNINAAAANLILNVNNTTATFIYVDGTEGWRIIDTGSLLGVNSPQYVAATGGTITTCGDYKIHTFTGPGTFTVTQAGNPVGSDKVDYLIVAGGGSGGRACGNFSGGGGGGGGFRISSGTNSGCYAVSPLGSGVSAIPVSIQGYPISIGGGGPTQATNGPGTQGTPTTALGLTSTGGGAGGGGSSPSSNAGGNGGSGGGANNAAAGGTGNTPPVAPPQGQNGATNPGNGGSGGGGAGQSGFNSDPATSPRSGGGGGSFSNINPATGVADGPTPGARFYAGGGGGGCGAGSCHSGPGGFGGGGAGAIGPSPGTGPGVAGTINTGGGGGGTRGGNSGAGGSGIVVIRYKFQ